MVCWGVFNQYSEVVGKIPLCHKLTTFCEEVLGGGGGVVGDWEGPTPPLSQTTPLREGVGEVFHFLIWGVGCFSDWGCVREILVGCRILPEQPDRTTTA